MRETSRRARLFEVGVLLFHLAVVLLIRSAAWPEVTTPGYLWSRGWLLYRDVKFLHTPGLMGLLALAFRAFGPQTWVVRGVAVAGPLAAQTLILSHTRRLPLVQRLLISLFFLTALLMSDGNAVWPTVLMSVLALPIAVDLTQGLFFRAGLGIGAAILLKQTAAFVLIVVVIALLARRHFRAIPPLVAGASLPYAAVLIAFSFAGAAGEMALWTLLVPFRVQEVTWPPGPFLIAMLGAAFLPTVAAAVLEARSGISTCPSAGWLIAVAFGFALLGYPNFLLLQTVAALPCLAAGAARLLEIAPPRLSALGALFLAVWTVSRAAILTTGGVFDGKVLFWNEDPDFNAVIARLERFPAERRVQSELWGNVLPRSRRLPPGRVWVHPMLPWYFAVEDVRERVLRAAREPGTVWVDLRSRLPGGERVGPYAIRVVGAPSEVKSDSRRTRGP